MPFPFKTKEAREDELQKRREYNGAHYQKHIERKRELARGYYKKNWKEYYAKNRERVNGHKEKWRKNNPSKWNAQGRKWRGEHFFKKSIFTMRSRAKTKLYSLENCATPFDLWKIWHKQKGLCPLSGRRLSREVAHLDHITASSSGGSCAPENLRWTHKDVNFAKRALTDADFIALCREVALNALLDPKTTPSRAI